MQSTIFDNDIDIIPAPAPSGPPTDAHIERVGRRLYLMNTPYAARSLIKQAGAKWDPEQRAWWFGSAKVEVAELLVDRGTYDGINDDMERLDPARAIVEGRLMVARHLNHVYAQPPKRRHLYSRESAPSLDGHDQ